MGTGWPWISVEPEASTTWINASACIASVKNWLPRPLPSFAPGTNPATSINFTAMKRVPLTHELFPHLFSRFLHAQSTFTWATPTLGSIVVKGKFPVGTTVSVAAEKKVDFPTFAFPKRPICIMC